MNNRLDEFGLSLDAQTVIPEAQSYRPPRWPPPRDWVCVEDENGNPISRWGDPVWDMSPLHGKRMLLNFGDGKKLNTRSPVIDHANADDLRLLVTWKIWGPRGVRTISYVVESFFKPIRNIFVICSQRGILARNLMKHPLVLDEISKSIARSKFLHVALELERLIDARDVIGFLILDRYGVRRLLSTQPERRMGQTPYIPPRIWAYQVTQLKKCLDDYLMHQDMIKECFNFCAAAYRNNQGGSDKISRYKLPFLNRPRGAGKMDGSVFYGSFIQTAAKFGIKNLLERWVCQFSKTGTIQSFSTYLNLVQYAGLAYIVNYSLMRVSEGVSMRWDCLVWHEDEKWGKVPIIRAETTKTDSDSDARWVVNPSADTAIKVLQAVTSLRSSCSDAANQCNPHLVSWCDEPWGGGNRKAGRKSGAKIRPSIRPYSEIQRMFPKLLDPGVMTITKEDLRIAQSVDPTLDPERYRVGYPWALSWHQLRRTGAVNMFASGMISDSSIQLQLKHMTRAMSLYYGRGNSSLRFNSEARELLVSAQYEAMGRELVAIHTDRFVSPHGAEHKKIALSLVDTSSSINLISEKDAQQYEQAARRHEINFRRTVLGGCMKNSHCDRDSIENIGSCAGGDGKAPCSHVLFDRERSSANKIRLEGVKSQLADTPPDSPRYRALEQEQRGLENYFAYISKS